MGKHHRGDHPQGKAAARTFSTVCACCADPSANQQTGAIKGVTPQTIITSRLSLICPSQTVAPHVPDKGLLECTRVAWEAGAAPTLQRGPLYLGILDPVRTTHPTVTWD